MSIDRVSDRNPSLGKKMSLIKYYFIYLAPWIYKFHTTTTTQITNSFNEYSPINFPNTVDPPTKKSKATIVLK